MKNKVVIGLDSRFLKPGFVASLIALAGMFLPYASVGGKSVGIFSVISGSSGVGSALALLAAIGVIASAALGVLNFVNRSKWAVRCWVLTGAVAVVAYSLLLFASKGALDSAGVFSSPFLVKCFGIGYWLPLVVSYAVLVLAMNTAKINPGYIVLVILSIIWLFPILWICITAFRAESGFYVGYFIPKNFTLDNFKALFSNASVLPFGRWYVNTLIVAAAGCIINTLIILGVAFVLSRTRFTGRNLFIRILMVIGMFPGFMSMLAVYNILKGVGLNQSLVALIIVGAAGAAMGYHICKGFFDTMPKAMDEAATIDGASKWQLFTKITAPLSKPIIIYTVLTNFLGAWSDYIFPSILFGDMQANYTVAVGLKWMTESRRIDTYYTQFAAGAVTVAVPIVILFIWLQRYYVEGLSGSVKG